MNFNWVNELAQEAGFDDLFFCFCSYINNLLLREHEEELEPVGGSVIIFIWIKPLNSLGIQ